MRGTPRCRRRCSGPSSCLYTHDIPDCHPSTASIFLPSNRHPLSVAGLPEECQRWKEVCAPGTYLPYISRSQSAVTVWRFEPPMLSFSHIEHCFVNLPKANHKPKQIQTSSDGVSNKRPNQRAGGVDSRHPDGRTFLRTAARRATVALFAIPSTADAIDVVCSTSRSECLAGQLISQRKSSGSAHLTPTEASPRSRWRRG